MAYCRICGNKISDNAKFCRYCGAKVIHISTQGPETNNNMTKNEDIQQAAPTDRNTVQSGVPQFTPEQDTASSSVPHFTPPGQNTAETGTSQFTAANQNTASSSVPHFTPPGQNAAEAGTSQFTAPNQKTVSPSVPHFTPPGQKTVSSGVPHFTPPTQNSGQHMHNGRVCYYHHNEPAVASCARCGKALCQDCFDSYGVTAGEYAGKALCYDCTRQLVADNVELLTANRNKIRTQFIISLIGMIIGFIFGAAAGSAGGVGQAIGTGIGAALIGGVFLSALKATFSILWDVLKTIFSGEDGFIVAILVAFFRSLLLAIQCVIATISNTIYYLRYLRRTANCIEQDQSALRQMQEYMEYTRIRNQNRGVDIETLLRQNSSLAGNSVAQMARTQSEDQIESRMRGCVATINENGEIIRNFRDANDRIAAAAAA